MTILRPACVAEQAQKLYVRRRNGKRGKRPREKEGSWSADGSSALPQRLVRIVVLALITW